MSATNFWDASPANAGAQRSPDLADPALLDAPDGSDVAEALRETLALGLRASYRHLASLQLAAGSPTRAAAMLRAAESLGPNA